MMELALQSQDIEVIVLRDYQSLSIEELRQLLRIGKKNLILCLSTGSGKTVIATYLLMECWKKGKRAIFVVDRITLIGQTSSTLDRYGIPHGIIQADHPRRNDELIQVASVQTLMKRGWPSDIHLAVWDEAHTLFEFSKKKLSERRIPSIGLTATPFTKSLGKFYDAVVNVTTTNKLTAEGHLVPFKVFAASEPDMTGCKPVAGEWTDEDCADKAMPIIGDVVNEYLKHGNGGKFIAFGVNVKHCAELQKQLRGAGIMCELYTYNTPDVERETILREFRKPDSQIRGLISVAALSKGFDVPSVNVIIVCRPLRKSFSEHVQIIGRGLRPYPGKEFCTILCHSGNMLRFWSDMEEFFEHGIHELDDGTKQKKKQEMECPKCGEVHAPRKNCPKCGFDYPVKMIKCPTCAHLHPPKPHCPECGHTYPTKRITHKSGTLHELGKGHHMDDEARSVMQDFYSQLLTYSDEKQYKRGWAEILFRERFGTYPKNLTRERRRVSLATLRYIRSRFIKSAQKRDPIRSIFGVNV